MIRQIVREEVAKALAASKECQSGEYLSTAEAADLARVTQGTIRKWIHDGRLDAHSAGREIRVLRTDLEKALKPGRRVKRARVGGMAVSPETAAKRMLGL